MAQTRYMNKYAEENNLKIRDAKRHLTLLVTPEDVKSGRRKEAQACGFAKACSRQEPKATAVHFFKSTAYVETEKNLTRYMLPPSMQKEIVAFDRARKMEPGLYEMKAPPPAQTLEAQREQRRAGGKAKHPGSKKGLPNKRHVTIGVRQIWSSLPTTKNKPAKKARSSKRG